MYRMKILAVLWTVCIVGLSSAFLCCGGSKTDDDVPTPPKPTTPITLDISKPDETKVDIVKDSKNGVEKKEYYPKDGYHIGSVTDVGKELWKASGDQKCCFARCYTKGDSSFLVITIKSGDDLAAKFFEKSGNDWKILKEDEFNDKVTTMIGGTVKYTSKFASKVNGSLFNALDSFEDNVKVLKLTAKEGVTAKSITYGSDTIWPGKKDVMCLSAVLYMDCGTPSLAVIKTKSAGGESTVYKYRESEVWHNSNVNQHKSKLEALKDKCKPGNTLDISKKENTDIGSYYSTCPDSGEIVHTFNLSKVVTKVVDAGVVIWEAPRGTSHKCTYAQITVKYDKETLRLEINTDKKENILFRKEGGKWKRVQVTQPKASQGSPNPTTKHNTTQSNLSQQNALIVH